MSEAPRDGFYAIRLVLRWGTRGAVAATVVIAALLLALLWPSWGVWSLVFALPASALVFIGLRSYVELVAITFSMVT